MIIPFVNLEAEYNAIQNEIDEGIRNVIRSFQFGRGRQVSRFENEFARTLGSKFCIGTGNGTDSLFIILKSLGIGPGDEVITPAWSWISTAETVTLSGARPVFADVDEKTYTVHPDNILKAITPGTRAVIVVHLYGQLADMPSITKICQEHGLFLIEDCAQAHLTEGKGKYAGTFGDAAAFSFYPTKNLGAYGDAGCIITEQPDLEEKMRRFANHGALAKDDHEMEGMNSRMDQLQAAVLLSKLPRLKQRNQARAENARMYSSELRSVKQITTPHVVPGTFHSFHIYALRADDRDELKTFLQEHGIQTLIHYPSSIPNLPPYKKGGLIQENYPVSTMLSQHVLSLPIYPELTQNQISYVCEKIKAFYKK
jgi:dTDP-4-amino-4,6-dideoxygalactose transaminase